MRKAALLALALFVFITAPLLATEEDPAWITASLKEGGVGAAKLLAGYLYKSDCKTGRAGSADFICGVLGDFSGTTKAEWEANVTKKLEDISRDVKAIADQQKEIERLLQNSNKEMRDQFDALPGKVKIANAEVKIKSLWGEYSAHFESKTSAMAMNETTMVNFAKEIMKADLHEQVRELNTALTDSVVDGKPYLQFPFKFYRTALQTNRPKWESAVRLADVYTLGEQKYLDFYLLQQRALILYGWAAFVLENECSIKKKECDFTLPITRDDFRKRVDGYAKKQILTFNEGLDWFILATSPTRISRTVDFLGREPMPVLKRANLQTATVLSSSGGGLWGRTYSMGDAWDGTMKMACGGEQAAVRPVEQYEVPVGGSGTAFIGNDSGPLDWWTKSPGSSMYNVVQFSTRWKVYHYSLPDAKAGFCLIKIDDPVVWRETAVKVDEVMVPDPTPENPKNLRKLKIGSMVAISRVGGSYPLLMNSPFAGMTEPEMWSTKGTGNANRNGRLVNIEGTPETEWFISPTSNPKIISLYTMGRGEYDFTTLSSRIVNKDKIQVWQTKNIEFPEGGAVTLHFQQGLCGQCKNSIQSSILRYKIENNPLPTSKGSLKARVAIYFDDANGGVTNLAGRGIVVDDSYTDVGQDREKDISGANLTGIVRTEPNKQYRLTYLIDFDVLTYGTATNATEYMYAGQISPDSLYLMK